MWFRKRVDSAVQTESHGEILEEIPEEELMNETGDSGVMPDSEAKTDEISADHTDESHGGVLEEIPEEELMNEIGDSGDKPVSEAKTNEISTEGEAQPFVMALMEMVTEWFRSKKEAIIIFAVLAVWFLLPSIILYKTFCPKKISISFADWFHYNMSGSFCPNDTKCNITFQHGPLFETKGSRIGTYKTFFSLESPYHTAEQPAIAMTMTCRHQDCEKKGSGYRMPMTGQCIRRECKCGYNTTEFQPIEACNNLHDSCATQLTLSFGFHCDDGGLKYGYNTAGYTTTIHQSAEAVINFCDSCAALLTISFELDCDDGVSKYDYNTTEFQSAETKNNPCGPCDTRFIQPFGIDCDDKVFSGEVEALLAEASGNVSIRVYTNFGFEFKGSTKKKASEKRDDKVDGSKTNISTMNTEL